MLTKKVKKRVAFLSILLLTLIISAFLILKSLSNNILYFKNEEISFVVTDLKNELIVSYSGTVPNLFAEGKGVVAEGTLQDKKFFIADRILAKHDENYMPPELKELFKKNVK